MVKQRVYVFCFDNSEFLQYQQTHLEYDCVMIVDGTTLRGVTPGKIVRIGRHMERWNYVDIAESIMRYEPEWQKHQDSADDSELDYGVT